MANVTTNLANPGIPESGIKKAYIARSIVTLALAATNDVLYALTIPSGHRVTNVTLKVVEATGETCTVAVGVFSDQAGSAVDADGFDASADMNAAVGTLTCGSGFDDNNTLVDALVAKGGYLNKTPAVAYIALTPTVSSSPLGALGKVEVIAEMVDLT